MARIRLPGIPQSPACLLALALLAPPAGATEELVDGIAAQVGGEIVLVSEVRELAAGPEEQLRAGGAPPEEFARLRADILESLVERALIRQVITRSEIGASEEELDGAIAAIATENNLTVEQLRASVERQGLSFADYRDRIRGEIERNKVVNGMVASRVRVDDSDVRVLYDEEFAEQPQGGRQFHLRHLLVPFTSENPEERRKACARARQARAQISGGTPFPQVAAQVSPVNPRQGGDIGWLHEDNLAPWMISAVESLSPGQTSEVIETNFGCNLLELVEVSDYTPVTFEQAREPLRQQIFEERMRVEYSLFIERLRGQTYIERKGYFADAARLGGNETSESGPGTRAEATAPAPLPGP